MDGACFNCGVGDGIIDVLHEMACGHHECYICAGRGRGEAHLEECYADLRTVLAASQATVAELREALGFLRPQVQAFAVLMEAKLSANDWKRGWQYDAPIALVERLREEVTELDDLIVATPMLTLDQRPDVVEAIGKEAADVANFALMIADRCGALATPDREAAQQGGVRE